MKKRFTLLAVCLTVGFGLFLGFNIMDNSPNGSRTGSTEISTKTNPSPVYDNSVIKYQDDMDGANDTTALKSRGYKIFRASPIGSTAAWFQGNDAVFPAFNGPSTGYTAANYNAVTGANNIDSWLILPKVNVSAGDSLSFVSRAPAASTFPDSIRVMYSATGDSTPGGSWVELGRFKVNTAGTWEARSYIAPAPGANARFAIRYAVVNGGPSGTNSDFIGIDAITVHGPPPVIGTCVYNWTPQVSGTTSAFNTVKAVNSMIAWAAGAAATIRRTTNGGLTWTDANPNPGVVNGTVYAIESFGADTAWCTTSPGATFIYRTTNGGTNWTQVHTQAGGFWNIIKFQNSNTGFIQGDPVGARWSLWKTTNAGATWDSAGMFLPQAGAEAGWNNSASLVGNNIWFGTNNTRVYHSTNFGSTWTSGPTTGSLNTYSVHFSSPTVGIGGGTAIVKTTDGGVTYGAPVTVPGAGNILGVEGKGDDFWCGRGTVIYRSTDGGATWALEHTAAGTVQAMDFYDDGVGCLKGYAVGATGSIAMISGVMVGTGNSNITETPASFKLSQNYPNPFNPTTKIKFALPKAGLVSLKVYDMLGKEVQTLVNQQLNAGEFITDFDGANLSSGTYFYRLQVGDFVEIKKMVLLK